MTVDPRSLVQDNDPQRKDSKVNEELEAARKSEGHDPDPETTTVEEDLQAAKERKRR